MSESKTKMFLDRLASHQGRKNLGTNSTANAITASPLNDALHFAAILRYRVLQGEEPLPVFLQVLLDSWSLYEYKM